MAAFGATGVIAGLLVRAASAAPGDGLTAVLLDLDGLGRISEQPGPERGDEFLAHVADESDRAFVTHLDAGMTTTPVLVAIMGLARAMRLEIVAEGVEILVQAACLLDLGVDHAHGILDVRPMPTDDLGRALVRPEIDLALPHR